MTHPREAGTNHFFSFLYWHSLEAFSHLGRFPSLHFASSVFTGTCSCSPFLCDLGEQQVFPARLFTNHILHFRLKEKEHVVLESHS